MGFRYEIRLSGAGGQGLILIGKILAEAAAIYDNKNATQSQSYGPEARGGASRSEVIISNEDIDYPKAVNIDLLLAMTQEACDKYSGDLKPDGVLLVDERYVSQVPDGIRHVYRVPITRTAEEKIGKVITANIVALGVLVERSKVVSVQAVESAILSRVPKGTEEVNMSAFRAGIALGRELADAFGK